MYRHDQTFSQLFVARSKRLCKYVAEAAWDQNLCHTFGVLIHEIDEVLPRLENNHRHFFPSQRMDYQRFKQEFHDNHFSKDNKAGAVYVWTAIRTFMKGSVESLSKDNFVVVENLGKNRFRVHVDLSEDTYDECLKYQPYNQKLGLWDDCDCMAAKVHIYYYAIIQCS